MRGRQWGEYVRRGETLEHIANQKYHSLLHTRSRFIKSGVDPDTHSICQLCRHVKPLRSFYLRKTGWNGRDYYCAECRKNDHNLRVAARREIVRAK